MDRSRSPLVALMALLLLPAAVSTQQGDPPPVIEGRLIDDESGEPIVGGNVELLTADSATLATVQTAADGMFRLVSPGPGTYRMRAERVGYRPAGSGPFFLMEGDSIGVEFRLAVEAVPLEPITVTASSLPWGDRFGLVRMEGFFLRYTRHSDSGFAEFMTRDSIARWEDRVQSTGDMLRWTTRLIRQVDPVSGEVRLRGGCAPEYYLNGSHVPYAMVQPINPTMLEAVEVYVRPLIPAQLGAGSPCGVVSYWSRQSPPEALPENPIGRTVALIALGGGLLALLLIGLQ